MQTMAEPEFALSQREVSLLPRPLELYPRSSMRNKKKRKDRLTIMQSVQVSTQWTHFKRSETCGERCMLLYFRVAMGKKHRRPSRS